MENRTVEVKTLVEQLKEKSDQVSELDIDTATEMLLLSECITARLHAHLFEQMVEENDRANDR